MRRTKSRKKKQPDHAYIRGLAHARLELILRHALEAQRYDIALEVVKAQCRLFGIRIDGPSRPEQVPGISSEAWQKLLTEAEQRRDS